MHGADCICIPLTHYHSINREHMGIMGDVWFIIRSHSAVFKCPIAHKITNPDICDRAGYTHTHTHTSQSQWRWSNTKTPLSLLLSTSKDNFVHTDGIWWAHVARGGYQLVWCMAWVFSNWDMAIYLITHIRTLIRSKLSWMPLSTNQHSGLAG